MRDKRERGRYKREEEGGCEEEEVRNIWKIMMMRRRRGGRREEWRCKGKEKGGGQGSCRTAHRGDAHGNSGTPILRSDVAAVLPPGLMGKRKHNIS